MKETSIKQSKNNINMIDIHEELKHGGKWLSAARGWMQSNIKDGDTICWNSAKLVNIPFCDLESFALHVAKAAVADERRNHIEELEN